eukprot:jgi/Mesen1/6015/ME000306S05280
MALGEVERLTAQANILRASLKKAQGTSDDMIGVLGSFDQRLSTLEAAMRPTQMRTHLFRKSHENIDSTVKEIETVLTQFDIARQVEHRVVEGPRRDLEGYLASIDRLNSAVLFFDKHRNFKSAESAAAHARELLQEGMLKLEEEFRTTLASNTKAIHETRLTDAVEQILPPAGDASPKDCGAAAAALAAGEVPFLKGSDAIALPVQSIMPANLIPRLHAIAGRMISGASADKILRVYKEVRAPALEQGLKRLGVEKQTREEIYRMQWEELEGRISSWIKHMRIAMLVLFAVERRLCDAIFRNLDPERERCLAETAENAVVVLLSFGEAIARSKRSPEKLFVLLDMYETIRDLLPQVEAVFTGGACAAVREAVQGLAQRLANTARETFHEFEEAVEKDSSKAPVADGAVHPLTSYVVNYIKFLFMYQSTLQQLFEEADEGKGGGGDQEGAGGAGGKTKLTTATLRILTVLQNNLEAKSRMYKEGALMQLFLMNNMHYMVRSLRKSDAKELLGDDWVQRHRRIVQQHATTYQRTAWQKALQCLNSQGLTSGGSNDSVNRQALKDRFKAFNMAFEELYLRQCAWLIPDPELRGAVQLQVAEVVLPAYRAFLKRFAPILEHGKNPGKYLKYTVDDLEKMLGEFFEGKQRQIAGVTLGAR